MYMGLGFGSSSLWLCDFVICTLIEGVTDCKDYIGKGYLFEEYLDPELDRIDNVNMVPVNYTYYWEDFFWAPVMTKPAISFEDKAEDMHFGAGN